eukprot:TRINITY_DN20884_c0_g1_i1.p1 TRINITY_DN20884_c0_g1~~TRINITY_DN20884_c0_g1_i1.p1  ORF type:complete len:334 (+),score=106.85 TRINITY_DN20884_c0_g1_i1:52-1053(+)
MTPRAWWCALLCLFLGRAAAATEPRTMCLDLSEGKDGKMVPAEQCCCVDGLCEPTAACDKGDKGSESGGPSAGVYIGIGIAVAVALGIAAGTCWWCFAGGRKESRERSNGAALTFYPASRTNLKRKEQAAAGDPEAPASAGTDMAMQLPIKAKRGSTPGRWGIKKWVSRVQPFEVPQDGEKDAAKEAPDNTSDEPMAPQEQQEKEEKKEKDGKKEKKKKGKEETGKASGPLRVLPALPDLPDLPPTPDAKTRDRDREITATAPPDDPLQKIIVDMDTGSPERRHGSDSSADYNDGAALWSGLVGLAEKEKEDCMAPFEIPETSSDEHGRPSLP